ncbi:zinc-dependent alcohol dehydrogenase family protein [Nonomuraea aurantiaca]|uniref:zinc-dependent alcohol dehydrogenase family protein n=1 Tax=Nonomuraea aurantiaca TaxID=2878562 RepID=UPI001CDA4F58|nr:NAD(P)-dependent alcohol dehydrogenase [Nonomuraea aurantiaca]MCA2230148.1 NAD(P)-dependent alcohol dehydrogenase [Nonomuraea aurantiaca]
MKQWTMKTTGRANLELTEAPIPDPAPGEILVKVSSVALNYRDRLAIDEGLTMTFPDNGPFVPGSDMAGEVVAVGTGADRFAPGDRVISVCLPGWVDGPGPGNARMGGPEALGSGHYPGVLSEYVALDQEWAVRAPASLSDVEASTLPMAGLSAWTALVEQGRVHAGQTVVVLGTGGVALFGLQIAATHGAEVIVVSGDDAKLARAKDLGAAHLINRTTRDWVEAVYQATHDRGADHILETIGGHHLARSIEAAAVAGHISLIGILEGYEISGHVAHLARKKLRIDGLQVGHRRALEDLVRAADHIALHPVIAAEYALHDLPSALAHLERGAFGKVVITTT